MPYKFTIEFINNDYIVTDYQIPRDGGNYYLNDMKSIFPKSVRKDMSNVYSDGIVNELLLDIQKQLISFLISKIKQ